MGVEEIKNNVVGMLYDDAVIYIKANGFIYRIIKRDGQPYVRTCDFKSDRINLNINKDVVISTSIG